jgi:hydroxymethylglutaryl-CoA lyase
MREKNSMNQQSVRISDVVLRDGLQLVGRVLPTSVKMQVIDGLYTAGVRHLDITSFVPPARFPQFADGDQLVEHARKYDDLVLSAFAPNIRGAERAIQSGVNEISFVVSVSESHNQANVRRSIDEQLAAAADVRALIDTGPRPVRLILALATAFGCSIEGEVTAEAVAKLSKKAMGVGIDELCLSDTVGYANPVQVRDVISAVRMTVGGKMPIRIHLHDTTGTGMACAFAAVEQGISHIDASLGGLGGCPFAPGASGNISTEDLVYMMETSGMPTGIDLASLLTVTRMLARELPEERFGSHLLQSGIPKSYAGAK